MPQVLPSRNIRTTSPEVAVEIGLTAAIVSVEDQQPRILTIRLDESKDAPATLPHGLFFPAAHRTLEIGLRAWVKEQTGLDLGYVEQLYTFGDRGRHAQHGDAARQVVSIGYLALTRGGDLSGLKAGEWHNWYQYFPWEDWRDCRPAILTDDVQPRLGYWSRQRETAGAPVRALSRRERLGIAFGSERGWDEEKALDRYELMYEAGLIAEAAADGRSAAQKWPDVPSFGAPMQFDHRRILATAMSRLRAKIKYRPVIFELMPEVFTLFELQQAVEAILGSHLHKQNFRRLVASTGLVEPTGDVSTETGGRPAKAFRFRREAMLERPAPGVRVKARRG
ncbi:MAG: NAD regulator [Alphaproteobacteria bacterium]